jgi:aspartate carbamoyltransferase catalytic subunit
MKRGLVTMRDLNREGIEKVLDLAAKYEMGGYRSKIRKVLGTIFFEPSTRTRLSFESAMLRLGGGTLGFGSFESSSIMKGESFHDTIRTFSHYCDLMVIRHPAEGSARLASELSPIPVINGGDGANEHPTQALCDLFTIKKERKRLDLSIALAGDLLYGRTVHSLAYALALFGAEILFISPPSLRFPDYLKEDIKQMGAKVEETDDLKRAQDCDVLYMTRIQRERMSPAEYEMVKGFFVVRKADFEGSDTLIMHPLPRVCEIEKEVDELPTAKYFDQVRYSVLVRMALIDLILKGGLEVRERGGERGKCYNEKCITNVENIDTRVEGSRCIYCEKPFG